MKTAFFVSTGRTGTDYFTHLFNHHIDNAWSLHEPKPAFKRRSYKLASRMPTLYEKYYFSLPRKFRHMKQNKMWYVETNYHLFSAMHLIRQTFENPLIFHIIRDGRDVVTSWLNRWKYIKYFDITPFHIANDPAQKYWDNWNPLQKLTWYWKTVNEIALSQNPDKIIYFEELFKTNKNIIYEVLELFADIDYNKEKVGQTLNKKINTNKIEFFPKYEQWPLHWKEQFDEIAGESMRKHGYTI